MSNSRNDAKIRLIQKMQLLINALGIEYDRVENEDKKNLPDVLKIYQTCRTHLTLLREVDQLPQLEDYQGFLNHTNQVISSAAQAVIKEIGEMQHLLEDKFSPVKKIKIVGPESSQLQNALDPEIAKNIENLPKGENDSLLFQFMGEENNRDIVSDFELLQREGEFGASQFLTDDDNEMMQKVLAESLLSTNQQIQTKVVDDDEDEELRLAKEMSLGITKPNTETTSPKSTHGNSGIYSSPLSPIQFSRPQSPKPSDTKPDQLEKPHRSPSPTWKE